VRLRALSTAFVALVATAGLLGGCGSGPSAADLAAQDKVVELGNQLASVHARVVQAQGLVARERRATARLDASPDRSAAGANGARRAGAVSMTNLCSPIKARGNAKAQRRRQRQRERARRRALSFLNLSCAAARA